MTAVPKRVAELSVDEKLKKILRRYEFYVLPEDAVSDEFENRNLARIVKTFDNEEVHQFTYRGRVNEVGYTKKGFLRVNFATSVIRDIYDQPSLTMVTRKPPGISVAHIHHLDPEIVLLQTHIGAYVRRAKIVGTDYLFLQVI